MILWLDLETYSPIPIKNGTYAYAEQAEVLLFAYAIDDAEPKVWDVTTGTPMPDDLRAALLDDTVTIYAHNAGFDRVVLAQTLPALLNQKKLPIERWRCTMAMAMTVSLPGSLAQLGEVLNIPEELRKQKEGKDHIKLFCVPRPKKCKVARATAATHPKEWAEFVEYATHDILAMRCIYSKLPKWNYKGFELELWHLDQRINSRGFRVDVGLARAAIKAIDQEQQRLAHSASDRSYRDVESATKRDQLLRHIREAYGVALPDLSGSTIDKAITSGVLAPELVEILNVRQMAATTSTAKYRALVNSVCRDFRLRGTLQYCGASRTGRFSGRVFQPHNLPRQNLKHDYIMRGIEALKAGKAHEFTPNVMELVSNAIRGCLVAAPGHKFVVADLANIEGRVLVWVSGESWKLQAFKDYDTIIGTGPDGKPIRKGHDLYNITYGRSFGVDPGEVTGEQRQIGKVMELALGYQGAVGAFRTFADGYNIDLEELAEKAVKSIPAEILEESYSFREWAREKKLPTYDLSDQAWVVCNAFKMLWRNSHPNTVALWKELELAAINSVVEKGRVFAVRNLQVRSDGGWLRIRLPSGRYLSYPSPKVTDDKLSYMGVCQFSRKWVRIKTYGGKLVENVVQAISRDVLVHGMMLAEKSGYPVVLSVHDELLTEVPDTFEYDLEDLIKIMSTNPKWAEGLPLAAAGFEDYRYRK